MSTQPPTLFPTPADDRLPRVHQLLLEHYGPPPPREPWDPLTQFIYSLLASRTQTTESLAIFERLRAQYPTWDELRDAPVAQIEQALAGITFAETKAPRIKLALQQITARVGTLTLDFLAKYRTEKVREWLEQFEGVGPQVSAAIVNFSTLRRRAISVDAHHLRVTQRLKLTPRADAAITEERLMRLVPPTWDAAMLDQHHALIKLHGQTLCTFNDPHCTRCPLLALCPTGQAQKLT